MHSDRELNDFAQQAAQAANSYDEFVRNLDGMYPGEGIHRLNANPFATKRIKVDIERYDSFLSSTWNFTTPSARHVADKVPNGLSLFVGTPSVYKLMLSNSFLVDIENATDNVSTEIKRDFMILNAQGFKQKFNSIVFDPPWSLNEYKKWISKSIEFLSADGVLIFPIYKSHTKPSAANDRKIIESFLKEVGFEIHTDLDAIKYETPSFEKIMLNRLNLPINDWKVADLITAHRNGNRGSNIWRNSYVPSDCVKVLRFEEGIVEIRVVDGDKLDALPPGFTSRMVSPSSRDPGNRACNVFTSDARRFQIADPIILLEKLKFVQTYSEATEIVRAASHRLQRARAAL